jgi:hypothetical protein
MHRRWRTLRQARVWLEIRKLRAISNCQPKRVADPGKALFTSAVECGRGESVRGWRDGIRRDLSWGYPFVGFGCGDVDTRLREFRRVQLVRARQVAQSGTMRGVAQLEFFQSVNRAREND